MKVDLDLNGCQVLVLGLREDARQALDRYRREGAQVTHFSTPTEYLQARLPARTGLVAVVAEPSECGADGWERIVEHYRSAGVPVAHEPPAGRRGLVTLVGGGCGSAGLLTQDALDALRGADTVLYDRLGPWEALGDLCTAELVDVGKLPGHHKVPQEEINALLVASARDGRNVVRFKGGDPYVFGRGSEELAACAKAGVP
ncbi:MAG: uroporphyrinogen-III C-methyltransferase, partial [Arthrobacter sp.]|nr:uroporphyrinogen-III C-methyltransferase [Arthrobacter sp.]